MERMLRKMAQQLGGYDEASLMALWDRYAAQVDDFEPSRRWEEAALVFSLIQAVRFKNQLFNHHLALAAKPTGGLPPHSGFLVSANKAAKGSVDGSSGVGGVGGGDVAGVFARGAAGSGRDGDAVAAGGSKAPVKKRCKVLRFRRSKHDKPV